MVTRRRLLEFALPGLALGALPRAVEAALAGQQEQEPFRIMIYEHGTNAGCCAPWVAKMVEAGFNVQFGHTMNPDKHREELGLPRDLWGCHTALIEGYVIEGHVTVEDIERLLKERPFVLGLAAPSFFDDEGNVRTEGTYEVVSYARPNVRKVFAVHELPG